MLRLLLFFQLLLLLLLSLDLLTFFRVFSLQSTLSRTALLPHLQPKFDGVENKTIKAFFTTGFDGAGEMGVVDQQSRNNLCQSKRETAHACLREISTENGVTIYDNENKNSPHGMRPWMIACMNETRETVTWMHETFMEEEIRNVQAHVFHINLLNGNVVYVRVTIQPWMNDGKVIHLVTGLGGAVCTKCGANHKDIHSIICVIAGFNLERDMDKVKALAESLFAEDGGTIKRLILNMVFLLLSFTIEKRCCCCCCCC